MLHEIPWEVPATLAAAAALLALLARIVPMLCPVLRTAWLAGRAALHGLVSDNPALLGVAGIGFAVSFETVARIAASHGLPGWSPLYPVGIDVGILALIIEARKAIDAHRSDLVPRMLAWCLAAMTIYVNAHGAAPHDWIGRALHVVMPALWVAFLELTRWRKLAKRRADQGDRIPRARWILSPVRTFGMRRRMILHNVRSYPVACAREEVRLAAISLMPTVWGDGWRETAPALLLHHLASGTLPASITAACSAASPAYAPALGEMAEEWVTSARASTARVAARARQDIAAAAENSPEHGAENSPADSPRKPAGDSAQNSTGPGAENRVRKPTRAQAKKMSAEQLADYVAVMLEERGKVTQIMVMNELHVAIDKAREALALARSRRVVVAIGKH